jgi:gamma-glutamylcyclotransferase (GGCT)/AIG2-like uncharacterized protein YtfP
MRFAVYGTLRKGYGNHSLLLGTNFIGAGLTSEPYRLTANGIPFVSKESPVSKVKVEVYETDNEDIISDVDSLEGHPRFYRREEIFVDLEDGSKVSAELYFCSGRESNTLIESGDYADYRTRR